MSMIKNEKTLVDTIRLAVLTSAELFDAWRTVPRLLVAGYGWLCWQVVNWYMNLQPFILEGCDIDTLADLCIVAQPTTQHAALVTAVVGVAAAVFGLYANSGRSWGDTKFVKWDDTNNQITGNPRNQSYRQNNSMFNRPFKPNRPPNRGVAPEAQQDDFWDSVEADDEFPSRSENFD